MIMMLILSISIIGIYTMVNNGQKLALLTDNRLIAINIAKEGIETVGALRDTFSLRAYGASNCFFTVDGKNYGNCPVLNNTTTDYIINDAKTLTAKATGNFPVCINENGWYSQENLKTVPTVTPCSNSITNMCGGSQTKLCRTQFTRKINFSKCAAPDDPNVCIKAKVTVTWWSGKDKTITLEQIFTKK